MARATGPLHGIRVLDLTSVLMGPYATQLLGQFGAEIIKLEPPEGDVMRQAGAMRNPGMGHVYLHANRNKRSIVVDLKNPEARPVVEKLVRHADVLVYNQRPQAMARLGLGYGEVAALNPAIIYAGGLGFSRRGRRAERPAYDDMIQTLSGIPWLAQEAGASEPRFMPGAFADRFVGLHLALAITAAIAHRERTGRGQQVDVPMYECMLSLVLGEHLGGLTFEPARGPVGYRRTLSRDRRPYRTRDGHVGVIIYTDRQWQAFFDAIGQPETFANDARFHTAASRSRHVDAIYGLLQELLQTRTTREWLDLFEAADIPAAPVSSIEDILADPHLQDTGFIGTATHPTEGRQRTVGCPFELSDSPAAAEGFAPRLGEHTTAVLRELGFPEAEIDRLVTRQAVQAG
jgi:crotonobetainyl-CoA:carnitine CoA-transferase CaiB-like acyl-CoA transferase